MREGDVEAEYIFPVLTGWKRAGAITGIAGAVRFGGSALLVSGRGDSPRGGGVLEPNVALTNGPMERSMQMAASDGLCTLKMVLTRRDVLSTFLD